MANQTPADLGNLILSLNPYTNDPDSGRGRSTGGMNILIGDSTPTDPGRPGTISNVGEIQVEVDTNYPAEWSFKGEPQKVNTAVRFPYRYPVYGPIPQGSTATQGPLLFWVTDYVLIGFEGSGGGS